MYCSILNDEEFMVNCVILDVPKVYDDDEVVNRLLILVLYIYIYVVDVRIVRFDPFESGEVFTL